MTSRIQSFRRRYTGEFVQIRAELHPNEKQFVILWDDICHAFPGLTHVYNGTILIPRARDSNLKQIEPHCIFYKEGKEFEILVKGESCISQPIASRDKVVQSPAPLPNNIAEQRPDIITSLTDLLRNHATDSHIPYSLPGSALASPVEQSFPWEKDEDSFSFPEDAVDITFQSLNVSTENDASFEVNNELTISSNSNIFMTNEDHPSVPISKSSIFLELPNSQSNEAKELEEANLEQQSNETTNQNDTDIGVMPGDTHENEQKIARRTNSNELCSVKMSTDLSLNDSNSSINESTINNVQGSELAVRGGQREATKDAFQDHAVSTEVSICNITNEGLQQQGDNISNINPSTSAMQHISRPIL
ncbi:hypothetical protein FBU30_000787 [Linnemannia zychae]|nr:hypothetical protein FBU30_000787 [Linnemannia zychae]